MTIKRTTIIMASTLAIAKRRADKLGIPRGAMVWPRSLGDLDRHGKLALYVDVSLWEHPRAEELADYIATRWAVSQPRPDRATPAGRRMSLVVNYTSTTEPTKGATL